MQLDWCTGDISQFLQKKCLLKKDFIHQWLNILFEYRLAEVAVLFSNQAEVKTPEILLILIIPAIFISMEIATLNILS